MKPVLYVDELPVLSTRENKDHLISDDKMPSAQDPAKSVNFDGKCLCLFKINWQ